MADDEVVQQVDVEETAGRERFRREMRVVRGRVGSPDGWLWTRITPAALSRTASRKSSPTLTSDVDTLPW